MANGTQTEALIILEKVELIYTPILVTFGLIGNALSIAVFFGTKLKTHSSSYYLSGLALSDSGFLLTLFITWLALVDVPSFHLNGVCQIIIYLSSLCSFLSVWMVVAFTTERFIAVRYPLLRSTMCTVKRAKIVLVTLTIFGILLYIPQFYIASIQPYAISPNKTVNLCGLNPTYDKLAKTLNNMDTFLTLVMPFIGITSVNVVIGFTVIKLSKRRRTLTSVKCLKKPLTVAADCKVTNNHDYPMKSYRSAQSKITNMLLLVSTVFLVLNVPSYVARLYVYFNEAYSPSIIIVQHIASILFNTNFGINFVLYCISGQNFRRELQTLFFSKSSSAYDTTRITVASESRRSTTTSPRCTSSSYV